MKKFYLILFLQFLAISCNNHNNEIANPSESITYSTSPIDLQGINARFAKDISYDIKSRTKFDIFIPNSSTPTGLVIYIHGGGFTSGDKEDVYQIKQGGLWDFPSDIRDLLQHNVAFATIRYSYLENGDTQGVIRCLNDAKRALQYIRYNHSIFNIDKTKIVLAGNSAGASSSLWLATHDDLKDINSSDPILKETTRVKGIAIRETQASLDVKKWQTDVFIDYNMAFSDIVTVIGSDYLLNFYGIASNADFNSTQTIAYRNNIDFLNLISSDDPEIWVDNTIQNVELPTTQNVVFHHAFHARELKEKYDALGLPSVFYYGKNPILYSSTTNENWINFAIRKINE